MFLQILLVISLGILAGIITGLTPGIHVNLISLILFSLSPFLLNYFSPLGLCCFIIAMSTVHSFLDSIPSVFLGAPDSDTVLNVLLGHKLLLEGKGFDAVKLTVIGSLLALIFSVILIPFLIPTITFIYPYLKAYIGHILLIMILFMIFKDKNRLKNLVIFFLAGSLGLATLNIPNLNNPLFPLLSGLFGLSSLLISILDRVTIPPQLRTETIVVPKLTALKAVSSSTFAGTLTSFFPGLGPAQGAVLASQLTRNLGQYGFMILVGGINTVNFVLSLVTFLKLDKARNGAVIIVSKLISSITLVDLTMFIGVVLLAGGIATFLTLGISKIFSRIITKINYKVLVVSIISFIILLTLYFSGFLGLLILFVSTSVGIIPVKWNVPRNHLMGCLLLPVMLYFLL